jgi:hypothetical protein
MSVDKILLAATERECTAVLGFVASGQTDKAKELLILLARKYFAK